jgi:hypothetical protein
VPITEYDQRTQARADFRLMCPQRFNPSALSNDGTVRHLMKK